MSTHTRDSLSVTPRKFDRFGDSHYLRIDSAEALRQVLALPEARWFASNAPIEAFRADAQFLACLNENGDGRIRPQEIKSAIRWLLSVFGRLNDDSVGSRTIRFDSIKKDSEEGRQVLVAAQRVLRLLGKEEQTAIDLNDVVQVRTMVEGDGLGQAGHVARTVDCSEPCRRLVQEIAETVTDSADLISEDDLAEFLRKCRELEAWEYERESATGSEWLPFGVETDELFQLYLGLRDRIDAFFTLCQLAKISPRVKAMATDTSETESSLDDGDLGQLSYVEALAEAVPLAAVNSDGVLKLNGPLNPIERDRLREFRERIVVPQIGEGTQTLKRDHWDQIKRGFALFETWYFRRPQCRVDMVDPDRRRNYVRQSDPAIAELQRLMAESRENAIQLESIRLLEKTLLLQAHLLAFANNFVSCPDLYSPAGRALFEMGTMILDGREFTFCVRVPDRERHMRRCQGENMFIIYAAISDGKGEVEYEIAAPVTSGFRGHLREGQWGVFHDSLGREHNAQVVRLLESPISLWEGLLAPFRRVGRAAILRLDSLSRDAETSLEDRIVHQPKKVEPERSRGFTRSFLASGGIAAAALGYSGAYMVQTLASTNLSKLFWGSIGIFSVLVLPLIVTTVLRLRNRDLRCLLEGANWGINLRMRLTPILARTFTRQRRL